MHKTENIIGLSILALSLIILLYFILKELRERSFLKFTLLEVIGKPKIDAKHDFIRLKHYLNSTIKYDPHKKNNNRPLLRETATEILKSNYGFCGENTRVAIKLFIIGGVKARRIYLFRKEWQHVLLEHQFDGNWYMFDGHYDENTLLKDEQVVSIRSENIEEYPDEYSNNPYLEFCRVKLFKKLGMNSLAKIKLPKAIVYVAESPQLIKGITFFSIGATVGLLFLAL